MSGWLWKTQHGELKKVDQHYRYGGITHHSTYKSCPPSLAYLAMTWFQCSLKSDLMSVNMNQCHSQGCSYGISASEWPCLHCSTFFYHYCLHISEQGSSLQLGYGRLRSRGLFCCCFCFLFLLPIIMFRPCHRVVFGVVSSLLWFYIISSSTTIFSFTTGIHKMGLMWECDRTVLCVYVFLCYINDVMLFFCMPAWFSSPSPSPPFVYPCLFFCLQLETIF